MDSLPAGTVTFLFTDIEGSTALAQQHPAKLPALLARHHAILDEAIARHDGHVFQIIGDAFCAAFSTAGDALAAALDAQRALQHEPWRPTPVVVRMGLHTGAAQAGVADARTGSYGGYLTLTRVQRVMSAAHGGQVLLSGATAELLRGGLPVGVHLRDLGEHRLKGLVNAEHLWQMVAPDLRQEFPALATGDGPPNNLPERRSRFIGRQAELEQVQRHLQEGRLVTLSGSGGIGKTRLAIEAARRMLPDYPDGAWLVELAPLTDPELVVQETAAVLGIRSGPANTGGPLLTLLRNGLAAKKLLLILDNCEHLIEACARLAEHLLNGCEGLRILATSREPLGIEGEISLRVPSLSLPTGSGMPLEELAKSEAVQLFVDRAGVAEPGYSLNSANAAAIQQICRRLDGIALAIELAASRVKLLQAEQIAARLDDAFRLLTGGSRTALPRQQTLRATIDWSYNLLSPAVGAWRLPSRFAWETGSKAALSWICWRSSKTSRWSSVIGWTAKGRAFACWRPRASTRARGWQSTAMWIGFENDISNGAWVLRRRLRGRLKPNHAFGWNWRRWRSTTCAPRWNGPSQDRIQRLAGSAYAW